ncbi:MAG: hypothetical protein WBL40_07070 [Terrimicrobiaceae bacterium]
MRKEVEIGEAFALLDTGHQIPPFSARFSALDLDDAYRVTAAIKQMRKRDGTVADHGCATNVLGEPVSALRHLVDILVHDQVNPALAAGEIVTTRTLTRALPASARHGRPNLRVSQLTASVFDSLEQRSFEASRICLVSEVPDCRRAAEPWPLPHERLLVKDPSAISWGFSRRISEDRSR